MAIIGIMSVVIIILGFASANFGHITEAMSIIGILIPTVVVAKWLSDGMFEDPDVHSKMKKVLLFQSLVLFLMVIGAYAEILAVKECPECIQTCSALPMNKCRTEVTGCTGGTPNATICAFAAEGFPCPGIPSTKCFIEL